MEAKQAPTSNRQAAQLEVLRVRLLLRRLDDTWNVEAHTLIIQASREALSLAGTTAYPLLIFPALFDELARSACDFDHRQTFNYWNNLRPGAFAV